MIRPSSLALLSGYTVAFALIAWTLLPSGPQIGSPVDPGDLALPAFDAPPPLFDSMVIYDAIVERPLFEPGRRPETSKTAVDAPIVDIVTPSSTVRLEGFRLAAVFRGNDTRQALIELPDGESLTVREGDRLENWRIVEIRDAQLILDHRGQRETLEVHDFAYLGEPPLIPRSFALTERNRAIKRRRPTNNEYTPQVPRQPRGGRAEEREEYD